MPRRAASLSSSWGRLIWRQGDRSQEAIPWLEAAVLQALDQAATYADEVQLLYEGERLVTVFETLAALYVDVGWVDEALGVVEMTRAAAIRPYTMTAEEREARLERDEQRHREQLMPDALRSLHDEPDRFPTMVIGDGDARELDVPVPRFVADGRRPSRRRPGRVRGDGVSGPSRRRPHGVRLALPRRAATRDCEMAMALPRTRTVLGNGATTASSGGRPDGERSPSLSARPTSSRVPSVSCCARHARLVIRRSSMCRRGRSRTWYPTSDPERPRKLRAAAIRSVLRWPLWPRAPMSFSFLPSVLRRRRSGAPLPPIIARTSRRSW